MNEQRYEIGSLVQIVSGNYSNYIGIIKDSTKYDYLNHRYIYEINLLDNGFDVRASKKQLLLLENIQNNLPAWTEDFLPQSTIDHIIEGHTLRGRIGHLSRNWGYRFRNKYKNFDKLVDSLKNKLITGGKLTKEEEEIASYFEKWDKNSYYPRNMSEQQITKVIREAYKDAEKRQQRKTQPTNKDKNREEILETRYKETQRFEGYGGQFLIQFYFSFTDMIIETAYPILKEQGCGRR